MRKAHVSLLLFFASLVKTITFVRFPLIVAGD
jgi:hypothetical protein